MHIAFPERGFMKQEHKAMIKELADLLQENSLNEIEYAENGVHLKVVRHTPATNVAPVSTPVAEPKKEQEAKNLLISPMVGVAYLSPSPDAPTYIKVGDTISEGQTICLIEAMKTFNPIKADKAGRITEILIETGSPVEYNQPLFRIG